MTEYDYSPEAYQRHLRTLERIGKWVDKTEGCRKQFANPFVPPPSHMPGYEEPPSASRHSPHRRSHNRSRSPSPGHSSGDEYGRGPYAPGPMNPMRSAPGHMSNFPKHQLPFHQQSPMPSPPVSPSPQGSMPPSYYGTPSIQQVKAQRRSQPRHFAPPPPLVLSPPVSPGMYGQPSPNGYVMVPQQMARPMPVMVSLFSRF
jgi:hypothetical protein